MTQGLGRSAWFTASLLFFLLLHLLAPLRVHAQGATRHVTVSSPNADNLFVDAVSGTNVSTITAGDSVEWDWLDPLLHSTTSGICPGNICAGNGHWDSGIFGAPHTFTESNTYKVAGVYPYFCLVHTFMMTGTVIVKPAPAMHFVFSAVPGSATAGVVFPVVIAAEDQFGNIDTSYNKSVTVTSSDGSFSASPSFSSGVLNLSNVFINKAGSQTLSITDSLISGMSPAIVVFPASHNHYTVGVPANSVAGSSFTVNVTAVDQFGNTESGYGPINAAITSSDGTAGLPANVVISNGAGSFTATLNTSGNQTISLNDGSIAGTSSAITVNPGAASLSVSTIAAQSPVPSGSTGSVTLQAKDAHGNNLTSGGATVVFNVTNGSGSGSVGVTTDNGNGTYSATFTGNQAGIVMIGATFNGQPISSKSTVSVIPGPPATSTSIIIAPASAASGANVTITLQAKDAQGNSETSGGAAVVLSVTNGSGTGSMGATTDNGDGTYSATFTGLLAGVVTIHATLNGPTVSSAPVINVVAGNVTQFSVSAPGIVLASTAFAITVTALDSNGNTVTNYSGTVRFLSTDAMAVLPANSTLTNGVGTFNATLRTTTTTQTVTAEDSVTTSIQGVTASITVNTNANAATHFRVAGPGAATAGTTISITVTARDVSNATATGYSGIVHFTSTDPHAILPPDSTLTNGTATFNVTFNTGSTGGTAQTVTATDTVTASITGSKVVNVSSTIGVATFFTVTPSTGTPTAGSPITVTVTALDGTGATATGYSGTVHFSSSDPKAIAGAGLPSDAVLTNGVGTFTNGVTLKTAGNQTVTVTDTVKNTITGMSGNIVVAPAAAASFVVLAPGAAVAGTPFSVTVTALDAFNNTATGYPGSVKITSSDGQALLPPNNTLNNGAGSFSVTLKTAGGETVTATDSLASSPTGISSNIAVSSVAAAKFLVSAPASATAGVPVSITVTAEDQFNNTAIGYTGMVHFTSSDLQAGLPPTSTLSSGTGSFLVTLKTATGETVTATDSVSGAINGTSGNVAVSPAATAKLAVAVPPSTMANASFSAVVTAQDAFGNTTPSYAGIVQITSSDGQAILPGSSTLNLGVKSFGVTLKTEGNQSVVATDMGVPAVMGSAKVNVSAAAATHFLVDAPANVVAGIAFNVSVTAQDAFGNTATGYSGTVQITSTDGKAILPPGSTLTNGSKTFPVTLETVGSQSVKAADATISGTALVAVSPSETTQLLVTAPPSATAGVAFSSTVTAQDAFGNITPGYVGTVQLASSDGKAVLPASTVLTNGTMSFMVTLKTAGTQSVLAGDTVTLSVNSGAGASLTVNPGPADHILLTAPGTATAGASFNLTVTVQDLFDNTATGYLGAVHFTSSDPKAMSGAGLPADYQFVGGDQGVRLFTNGATLKTAPFQTVTATDKAVPAITGAANITVTPGATSKFKLTAPANVIAGSGFSIQVTAQDAFANKTTGYTGTVMFNSSDGQVGPGAGLPTNYTFIVGDNGLHSFNLTLKTAGNQTVSATDTGTPSITGTTTAVNVQPAQTSLLQIIAPATSAAGAAFNITVNALDAFNNITPGYGGTVQFTSSDNVAILPPDSMLTNGTGSFSVTLMTIGNQNIMASDSFGAATAATANVAVSQSATKVMLSSSLNPVFFKTTGTITATVTLLSGSGSPTGNVVFYDGGKPLLSVPLTSGTAVLSAGSLRIGTHQITATFAGNANFAGSTSAVLVQLRDPRPRPRP